MKLKLLAGVAVLFLAGILFASWNVPEAPRMAAGVSHAGDSDKSEVHVMADVLSAIQEHYAAEVSSSDLVEEGIRGFLRALDPHSSLFSVADFERLRDDQRGRYYGLGILVRPVRPGTGRVVIVEPPSPGTPGYRSGLRAGDVIARIEGHAIDDWDYPDEVVSALKGPKGTTVTLTIERLGEPEPIVLTVERDEIPLYTIRYAFRIRPGIGYVRIDRFSDTTGQELRDALRELDEASLSGLILDLRDNPGGSLNQAIDVADRFLERNQLIVSTHTRRGRDREFKAPRGSRLRYPMVVLINQNSASASEIVAGALQDHHRALIVGNNSFGKALVQTVYPLAGNRGLALTTGKYYTPSGRLIQRDYSGGLYDYYYGRLQASDETSDPARPEEEREDDPAGGIAPDHVVEVKSVPREVVRLGRGNLFYEFASRLTSGMVESDVRYRIPQEEREGLGEERARELIDSVVVTDRTLELFHEFLDEKDLELDREVLAENADLIRNRLRQELLMNLFGDREGYRVGLEFDHQVQEAVRLIPQARVLSDQGPSESG